MLSKFVLYFYLRNLSIMYHTYTHENLFYIENRHNFKENPFTKKKNTIVIASEDIKNNKLNYCFDSNCIIIIDLPCEMTPSSSKACHMPTTSCLLNESWSVDTRFISQSISSLPEAHRRTTDRPPPVFRSLSTVF